MRKTSLIIGLLFTVVATCITYLILNSKTTNVKAISVSHDLAQGAEITSNDIKDISVPRGTKLSITSFQDVIGKFTTRALYPGVQLIHSDVTSGVLPTKGYIVTINTPSLNLSTGMQVSILNTPTKDSSQNNNLDKNPVDAVVQSVSKNESAVHNTQMDVTLIVANQDIANKLLLWNATNNLGVEIKYGNN